MEMMEDRPIREKENNHIKSSTNTEPILHEHLRRLMNDISNYLADYKLAMLLHALEDLYTLIRPRLKNKEEIIKDLDNKREQAQKALAYNKEDLEKEEGWCTQQKRINLRAKLYTKTKPLLLDFQTALYEQLYELKLILGGGNNE